MGEWYGLWLGVIKKASRRLAFLMTSSYCKACIAHSSALLG
jgi:hypothetical protein